MSYQDIIYTKSRGIGTITLNRPVKGNAYTQRMCDEIVKAIEEAKRDIEVKVLVLKGAGKHFSAGYDLDNFPPSPEERHPLFSVVGEREGFHRVVRSLRGLDKPTIASVNGAAMAAGFVLALACDFRIASRRARFGDASIKFGFVSDEGLTYFLPRVVGIAKAAELILLGEVLDAEQAFHFGLVTKVVPEDELDKSTQELAARLAEGPPVALRLGKRAVYSHAETDLDTALEDVALAAQIANETEDAFEGVKAFREKRVPSFKGK